MMISAANDISVFSSLEDPWMIVIGILIFIAVFSIAMIRKK